MDKLAAYLIAAMELLALVTKQTPDNPPTEPFEYQHVHETGIAASTSTSDQPASTTSGRVGTMFVDRQGRVTVRWLK